MKSRVAIYLLIMIVTAIAGEIKIIPFGEAFRVALGSAAFFFLVLWFRQIPVIWVGIWTGLFIPVFRIGLDFFFLDPFVLEQSIKDHAPAFFYYFLFSLFLHALQFRQQLYSTLLLGLAGVFADFMANAGELVARRVIEHVTVDMNELTTILIVAVIRSYFVVGLYSNFHLKGIRMIHEEKEKRMLNIISVGSGLYQEALYLQKSMGHIEEVTSKSYALYRTLRQKANHANQDEREDWQQIVNQSLQVAQEVHEVKKNSQRILAGLQKMFRKESFSGQMSLEEIVNFSVKAHQNYAEMLGKEIVFFKEVEVDLKTSQYYPIVSVINNLLANAVEAIHQRGQIHLSIRSRNEDILFTVEDTGKGIDSDDIQYIFEPGYTTKYDQAGVAATGIGLSHVKDIVNRLNGEIHVQSLSDHKGAKFVISIPSVALVKEETEIAT